MKTGYVETTGSGEARALLEEDGKLIAKVLVERPALAQEIVEKWKAGQYNLLTE